MKTARGRFREPFDFCMAVKSAESCNVLRCFAFAGLDQVEFDLLALTQSSVTLTVDSGVVNETVLSVSFRRNESIALALVEPLHGAGRAHEATPCNQLIGRRRPFAVVGGYATEYRKVPAAGSTAHDSVP